MRQASRNTLLLLLAMATASPDGPVELMVGLVPGASGPREYGNFISEESRRWTRFLEQNPGIAAAD